MLRSTQYSFQNLHFKYSVRFQTAENIQDTLSAAFALLWISNLARKDFLTSTGLVAKLIDMAGLDDFSKISVSIHSFAVNFIQISITGLKKLDLCRKNIVLHAGNRLIIILFFHCIHCIYHDMVSSDHHAKPEFISIFSVSSMSLSISGRIRSEGAHV